MAPKVTNPQVRRIYNSEPPITSRDNSIYRKLLSLHASKGIKLYGEFLAGGEKIVGEILRDQKEHITAWIRTPDLPPIPPALPRAKQVTLSKERFHDLNSIGTTGPLLSLALPEIHDFSAAADWPQGCTLFIPFGDPENIGAVIRSAVGFGVSRVVLLREAASPFLPKAFRASAGSILRIRIENGPALKNIAALAGAYPIFALDLRGRHLADTVWPATFGLLAGMEGQGLPDETRLRCVPVSIPLQNGLDSLNAAAAVSIALWAWKAKNSGSRLRTNIRLRTCIDTTDLARR